MKICCVSDLHGHLPEIPSCDLLLIAGDICPIRDHSVTRQERWMLKEFIPWAREADSKSTVLVGGNHDFCLGGIRIPGIHYLQNDSIGLMGFKIYGTPYTPSFGPWAFMAHENVLAAIYANIPNDTDILITHGPQAGGGGRNSIGIDCGSIALREKMRYLTNLKLHIYGHIHEDFGDHSAGRNHISKNVSIMDLSYHPNNPVTIVEIPDA